MKNSRRIEIIRSESNRLDELIDTYSVFKKEELQESVLRIKKRLGPQRTKIALESINNEKWDLVCKSVLDYYDKCYEYEKVGKTNIKDKVFVGSNTSLVAPVTLNEKSVIGAGSVITKNVSKGSLALTRSNQKEKKNYKRK